MPQCHDSNKKTKMTNLEKARERLMRLAFEYGPMEYHNNGKPVYEIEGEATGVKTVHRCESCYFSIDCKEAPKNKCTSWELALNAVS